MSNLNETILVVDDNEDDIYALRRALRKANITHPQQVVMHGREAIDYLAGAGKYSDRALFPLPFLVFLDLKTPFLDGFEVLEWIRGQPQLSQIVIVILTGSDEVKDHQRAYSLGARSYLVKPPSQADLQQLLQSLASHWLRPGDVTQVDAPA